MNNNKIIKPSLVSHTDCHVNFTCLMLNKNYVSVSESY